MLTCELVHYDTWRVIILVTQLHTTASPARIYWFSPRERFCNWLVSSDFGWRKSMALISQCWQALFSPSESWKGKLGLITRLLALRLSACACPNMWENWGSLVMCTQRFPSLDHCHSRSSCWEVFVLHRTCWNSFAMFGCMHGSVHHIYKCNTVSGRQIHYKITRADRDLLHCIWCVS